MYPPRLHNCILILFYILALNLLLKIVFCNFQGHQQTPKPNLYFGLCILIHCPVYYVLCTCIC